MNKTIWKFELRDFCNKIKMPKGSKVLTAQLQNEMPCIWAEVDSFETDLENRYFYLIGTGQQFPDNEVEYISTVQADALVWHIYEIKLGGDNAE